MAVHTAAPPETPQDTFSGLFRNRRSNTELVLRKLNALHDLEAGYSLLRTCASLSHRWAGMLEQVLLDSGLPAAVHATKSLDPGGALRHICRGCSAAIR